MEVVSRRPLTNYEVAKLLSKEENAVMNDSRPEENKQLLEWINNNQHFSSQEEIKNVVDQLDEFNLYQQEKIHLINHRPQNSIDIHLILNSNEEKVDGQQVKQIEQILAKE